MTVETSLVPAPVRPDASARRDRRLLRSRGVLRAHSVLLASLATLVTHALYLTRELGIDEGGFATVARFAHAGGPYLYGPTWVDRPPGLISVFALAEHLGPYGVRATAALLAVLLVGAVATAARVVAGPVAASWSAWTAFALSSSVLLQAQRLNGELVAASFVSVAIAALLVALLRPLSRPRRLLTAMVAGAAASAAVLSKQNFVDGFVFAAALFLVGLIGARRRADSLSAAATGAALGTAVGFAAGAALPLAAAALWSAEHGGPDALLFATFGFRSEAAAVMAHWSLAAPLHRLGTLVLLGLGSGIFLLGGHLLLRHGHRLRRPAPLPWAIAAAAAVELVGIAAGGNFWPHYLIALVPTVSLAVGLGARPRVAGRTTTRALAVAAVLVTAIAAPVTAVESERTPSEAYLIGHWVGASSRSGDTLVVPFTHANVIDASGLEPGYPYAWSLPVRTLDPNLSLLVDTLESRRAPTWVVRWDDPDSWGLDPHGAVARALLGHYRHVATVCGKAVWLHDGVHRPLAPMPHCPAS